MNPDSPAWAGFVSQPRARLAVLPTPLHLASRLSRAVGAEVWFKRDDLTGLGLGGNKVRTLEFVIGSAVDRGADTLITGGGPNSNWVMLAALAARTRGLDAILVIYGDPVPLVGNLHLAAMAGARVEFTGSPDRASVEENIEKIAARVREEGRVPYLLGRGGASPVGALGYVAATLELTAQLRDHRLTPSQLWLATGSCGTQAGLEAGAAWLEPCYEIHGVSVSRPVQECVPRIREIATAATELIHAPAPTRDPIVDGSALAVAEYGKPSLAADEATRLVAQTEGVFLDPVFAARAMASMLASLERAKPAGPVVFLVTGGAPTLFHH
ncbi:MAG: 1-aminocyclopropane-1-carboxylate deaminase/D-cysteine desulfhydrase [Sporichthyaceae bacterium]